MPPSPVTIALTRRQGLLALALGAPAVLLAACTEDAPSTTASASPASSGVTAGESLASQVAAEEAALVAQYDAALATLAGGDAGTVALLTTLRDNHVAHRDALGGSGVDPAGGATASTGNVLAELLTAERAAARSRVRACVDADDPAVARTLSLIAAAEAAHVAALRAARS